MKEAAMFRARTDDMDYRAVFGWYLELEGKPTIVTEDGEYISVKKTTLDRWTRLYDKDGTPIYSGDIIRIDGDCAFYQVSDDWKMFHVISIGINWGIEVLAIELEEDKIKVIGNQYSLTANDVIEMERKESEVA